MSTITIHKVVRIDPKVQPICGAFIAAADSRRGRFVSVHDETVNCSRCLKLIEEMQHKSDDGRLVF